MAGKIHLIRHAEAEHNVSKNFSLLDPGLTDLGKQQAAALTSTFPHPEKIGLIISSPLRRTIQTTLLAFPHVLNKRYYSKTENESGKGVDGGVELVLEPELQERSAEPCDTGSETSVLRKEFPGLEFGGLGEGWRSKRAESVRRGLKEKGEGLEGERRDVVVVTHGVFMKFLSGEKGIDLPKAGWKTFVVKEEEVGVVLVPA